MKRKRLPACLMAALMILAFPFVGPKEKTKAVIDLPIISVSFPTAFSISVDNDTDTPTSGTITNNSSVQADVSFLGICGDANSPKVTSPNNNDSYWKSLNETETATTIMLGFNIAGTEYWSPAQGTTSPDSNTVTGKKFALDPGKSMLATPIAKHGNQWSGVQNLNYTAYFLCDRGTDFGKYRYIRDSLYDCTPGGGCQWTELAAWSDGVNVALHKPITVSSGSPSEWGKVNDGVWDLSKDYSFITLAIGNQWVQIDLGQLYKLDYIRIWHYYLDNRTYHHNTTQVSADGVTWVTLFNSDVNGEYSESYMGHTMQITNPCAPATNSKGTPVRYIRSYLNGNIRNSKDLWTEIAAYTPRGNDIALYKTVTADGSPIIGWVGGADKDLSAVTDGDYTSGDDTYLDGGQHYVQVDLGQNYNIDRVQVCHYANESQGDPRLYHDVITQISTDGVNWKTIYNSNTDGEYWETSAGKTIRIA